MKFVKTYPLLAVLAILHSTSFTLHSLAAMVDTSVAGQVTITVEDNEGDYTITAADANALATSNALIKKGGGRLVMNRDLSHWKGDFGISNGYVRLMTSWADGTNDNTRTRTLRLEPGATIELGGSGVAANRSLLRQHNIYIGGTGVGGAGALCAIGNSQNQIMYNCTVHLTADTLFKCSPTVGPRATQAMYFNGHKLTADGGTLELCGDTIYGPGEIYAINGCRVWMENGTPGWMYRSPSGYVWKDGDKAVIRLGPDAKIQEGPQRIQTAKKCEWDVVCEGDATICSSATSQASSKGWTGSYGIWGTLTTPASGTLTFDLREANNLGIFCSFDVPNVISGGADIIATSGANYPATLNLNCTTNTTTGALTINKGVTVNAAGPLYGVLDGRVTGGTNGVLNIDLSSTNLTDNALYAMWKGVSDNLVWPTVIGTKFFAFNYELGADRTFSRTLDEPLMIYHGGTNALTIASSADGRQNYINEGGDLILAGKPGEKMKVGWIDVRGGTVTIPAGAHVEAEATNCVFIAADYPEVARFVVKGTYVNESKTNGVAVSNYAGLYAARNYLDASNTRRGIIELYDGAVVTNRIDGGDAVNGKSSHLIGSYADWQGSYFQHGGTFITPGGYQYFGSYHNMYASIEGGKFVNNNNNCRMGRRAGVTSFIDIKGGVFETQNIGAGQAGAQATICVSGNGKFQTGSMQHFPRQDNEAKTGGSHAIFAVDGSNATAEGTQVGNHSFVLAGQYHSIGEVDLNNGGTISANGFGKALKYKNTDDITDNVALVSFNGGILRTSKNYSGSENKGKIFRNFKVGTDHVYVHAGGATIDTCGLNIAVGTPLEAPSGNGVESIPLPQAIASLKAWDYIAAPAVTITDPSGTGSGATAVAIFDTITGKVTGFRVLNRGQNYTSATATISKGGYTNTFTVACTLSANGSGGLTKKGTGKLVLDCANSYTGATVVAGGTLVSSNAAALTSTRALRLEGGTLDLTTQDIPDLTAVEQVVLAGGTVVNDAGSVTLPANKCALDIAAAKAGNATTVTSAMTLPGSFNLLNGELAEKADRGYTLLFLPENYSGQIPTVTDVPPPWVICLNGRKVRMAYPRFQIILR